MEYKNIAGVSRTPLSEQVYRTLVDSIASGTLSPGSELREQHLAKMLNVSATPVREAIRRLASDGLVEIVPYHGAVVRCLDKREIREAYACREALEHLVVAECIERLRDADIQNLYALIARYKAADGPAESDAASQQFDEYLYTLADNRTLHSLLDALKGTIARDRKYSSGNTERKQAIAAEHEAVVEALAAKDLQAARQAVSTHIHNGRRFIENKS